MTQQQQKKRTLEGCASQKLRSLKKLKQTIPDVSNKSTYVCTTRMMYIMNIPLRAQKHKSLENQFGEEVD